MKWSKTTKNKSCSKCSKVVILVCMAVIFFLIALFFYNQSHKMFQTSVQHTGEHILMLLPSQNAALEEFRDASKAVADKFNMRIEMQDFSTVSEQKKMLSLVPMTDIDGVLLWPVSNIDDDYKNELTNCQAAGIPVVIIGHDLEAKSLRNSFIGSGINSELMVINQLLWSFDEPQTLVIGGYAHASNGNIYELLVMEPSENVDTVDFDDGEIWNERLSAFVENHPNGYYASKHIQIRTNSGGVAALNQKLLLTLNEIGPISLFFSLDETLTSAMASACASESAHITRPDILVGYGDSDELKAYTKKGIVDELIVSDALYSSSIGLHYIHDILRGFYVPSVLDSGIKLIT